MAVIDLFSFTLTSSLSANSQTEFRLSPLIVVAIEFQLHIDMFDGCQNCSSVPTVRRLHLNLAFSD